MSPGLPYRNWCPSSDVLVMGPFPSRTCRPNQALPDDAMFIETHTNYYDHRDSHELLDLAPITLGEDVWVMPHGVLADTTPGRPRHPRGCPRPIPSRGGANASLSSSPEVIRLSLQMCSASQVRGLMVVGSEIRSWGPVSGQRAGEPVCKSR